MHDIVKSSIFAPTLNNGTIGFLAQLVEQWIENPCVPGSIPGETTLKPLISLEVFLFYKSFNIVSESQTDANSSFKFARAVRWINSASYFSPLIPILSNAAVASETR